MREAEFYQETGSRIREARERLNMTQQGLADKLHMSRTSVTNIEAGNQKILAHLLRQLAVVLESDVEHLLPDLGKRETGLGHLKPEDRKIVERGLAASKQDEH